MIWAALFNICSGQEYPAVVEFAPFQKISKKKLKKKDAKAGSIEEGSDITIPWHCHCGMVWKLAPNHTNAEPSDPEYKRFLENISCDEEKSMANPETLLGEIEAKTRELIGTSSQ